MRIATLLLLGVQGTALINVITKQGRILFTNPVYTNDVRGTTEQYAIIRSGQGRGRSGRSTESGRGGYGQQNLRTGLGSRKEDVLPTNSSITSRVKRSPPASSSKEDLIDDETEQSTSLDTTQFGKINEEERLQKVIARAGIASRREAEKMILDGRVVVNGKLIVELGEKVKPRKDIILVDGKKVVLPDAKSTFWVLVNKPRSVLTTMEDDKDRETLLDIVPKAKELRLLPVGRLDRVTTGLMILTNDNGWIHPLTHPSFRHVKRYEVVVQGFPSDEAIVQINQGTFTLPGDSAPLLPCKTVVVDTDRPSGLTLIDITLEESRPQQIQQMMEHLECPVVSMKRTEFGPMKLGSLRKGQWREMTASEIGKLKDSCEPARSTATATTTQPSRQQQRGEGDRFRGSGGRGGVGGRFGGGGVGGRQSRVFGMGRGRGGGGRDGGRGGRGLGRSFVTRPPGSGYASKAARGIGQGQVVGVGLSTGRGRGRGQGISSPGRAGRGAGRQGLASGGTSSSSSRESREYSGDNESEEYRDNDFRR